MIALLADFFVLLRQHLPDDIITETQTLIEYFQKKLKIILMMSGSITYVKSYLFNLSC